MKNGSIMNLQVNVVLLYFNNAFIIHVTGKRSSGTPREFNTSTSVSQNLQQFCQEMPVKIEKLLKVSSGLFMACNY
jgi:hypothetical protein